MESKYKFVLHIGRHKSGTSSLQKFLFDSQAELQEAGWLYPKAGRNGIAHHSIAGSLSAKAVREDAGAAEDAVESFKQALAAELAGRPERVLLSSEAFQNAVPALVGRCFPNDSTQVIVYLREQAEYVVSSYQQQVHAQLQDASIAAFAERPPVSYLKFLNAWTDVFGHDAVRVRKYDRANLVGGSVVDDFLSVTGLPLDSTRQGADQNPSIGGALLELKRVLNHCAPDTGLPRKTYMVFSEVARIDARFRIKPALSADGCARLRAEVADSNQQVAQKFFGGGALFDRMADCTQVTAIPQVDFIDALSALAKQDPTIARLMFKSVRQKAEKVRGLRAFKPPHLVEAAEQGNVAVLAEWLSALDAWLLSRGWTWNPGVSLRA